MIPLPDEPIVVMFKDGLNLAVATNVAANLMLVSCETKEEFDEQSKGLSFNSTKE